MSDWISVEDEYPEDAGSYLCCCVVGSMTIEKKVSSRFISKADIRRKNTNVGDWIRLTHWMPLPEPPRGNNEN